MLEAPETIDLTHILFLLAAAVLIVPIFQRLSLGSVLGYIAAGTIIGPWGLGFIHQVEKISHIAEFGVVFLLFIIGIELNFTRLIAMKRTVFGLGTAQLVISAIIFTVLALLLGTPKESAIIIGFGLALSSTAFGLQTLIERKELGSVAGRTSFSILLLQDLAVAPLLALVSFMAHDASLVENVEFAFLKTIFVIIAVILAGRFLLTPALHMIAKSHNTEVFIATAILVVLGTAWIMEEIGLSMALGAFLAGLMLADSHYRHQIIADIQPFRGMLLGLFFMSVGMSIDLSLLVQKPLLIAGLVVALLSIKIIVIWCLCKITKLDNVNSMRVSILLSQSGEFGFVLFGLALATGLMEIELFQILTLIIAISMASTPFMAMAGEHLEKLFKKDKTREANNIAMPDGEPFIIIAGFGRVGRRVAKILEISGINYIALDNNPDLVKQERASGFSVVYGNAGRYDVLNTVGAAQASAIVITIDKNITTERLVHVVRKHCPETPIYVRGQNKEHCERLHEAGATIPVSETLEASLKLSGAALSVSGIPDEEVTILLENFRKSYYGDLVDSY